jgi:hypothetical protein
MYRVPRSARSHALRRLKIGTACLLAIPTIGFNIYGILAWESLRTPIERITRNMTNYGIIGLLPTGIQLIVVCLIMWFSLWFGDVYEHPRSHILDRGVDVITTGYRPASGSRGRKTSPW